VIWPERLGLTGIGGGGTGESIDLRDLWSSFKVAISSLRARDLEDVRTALEVGSSWIGRRVKVSVSSIVNWFDACDLGVC